MAKKKCPLCHGVGTIVIPCLECDGVGYIYGFDLPYIFAETFGEVCLNCNGSGIERATCPMCKGEGVIQVSDSIV